MGFFSDLLDELTSKTKAVHPDGSEGEFKMQWSADYLIRWYSGPRAGKTQYVAWFRSGIRLHKMPPGWNYPA